MRLLIAGGGTGGHIYPALAVARSLRARPGAPELAWLGGHRGLERDDRARRPGSRCGGSLLRSLRSAGRDIHLVLDPIRLGLSVPQAFVLLLAPPARRDLHDRRLRRDPDAARRRPSCGSRACCGRATSCPGRQRPASSPRLATVLAVSHPETAAALGHPRAYVTGHADPVARGRRRRRGARAVRRPARASGSCWCSAGRRPCAGSTTRSLAALPRLVERVRVVHVTGDGGYAAALAAREALPEELRDRYRPHAVPPRRRDDRGARRRGPRRRAGRRVDARRGGRVRAPDGDRARTRTPRATSGATPSVRRRRRRDPGRGRGPRRRPAGRGRRAARRSGRATPRCPPRRASSPGPTPPPRSRTSCSRSPTGRRCRRRPRSRPSRGAARVTGTPVTRPRACRSTPLADRHGHPAPDRRQDVARRAAGPVHDDARRRPGRPVRRRPQPFELRGLVRFARARAIPLLAARAGERPRRSPMPGSAASSIQARAEGARIDGERYHADAGVPMARAATETPEGGPDRARVRARDPGHGRRRGVGERRRARARDGRRPRVGDGPARRRLGARRCPPPSSASPTATAGSRTPSRRGRGTRPRSCWRATFRAPARRPRRDQGAGSTRSAAGARRTSRSGIPSAGSVFRNPDGDSAGRLIDGARAQGLPDRRRRRVREARQLHRQRPARDGGRRAPARASSSAREVRDRHGVDLAFEIEFAGDWSGWPPGGEPPDGPCRRSRHDPAATPVAVRPGRAVGGARRLDRVGVGDRRRAARRPATRSRPG